MGIQFKSTMNYHDATEEIEYYINCMGEDIRRIDTNGGRFESVADYREQVTDDTKAIFNAIDRLEQAEATGGEYTASTKKSFNDLVKAQRNKAQSINKEDVDESLKNALIEIEQYISDAWTLLSKANHITDDLSSANHEYMDLHNDVYSGAEALGNLFYKIADKYGVNIYKM